MKSVEQQNIKKLCNFYVSNVHLSVMLLPYISKEINNDVEVTTIFEKTEKKEFEEILEKLNIKNKKEILNINWIENCTEDEIEKNIKNRFKCGKKNTIIIGGGEKFISNINNLVNKKIENNSNVKIIDCYNIEEIESNMKNIIKEYDGVINTLKCIENV